ncbi:MAG TPA: MFS transporter [Candidatus Paceibacterota bacterium]|nr:MFS transporter [Candidatus Paceibacterota bacterium]
MFLRLPATLGNQQGEWRHSATITRPGATVLNRNSGAGSRGNQRRIRRPRLTHRHSPLDSQHVNQPFARRAPSHPLCFVPMNRRPSVFVIFLTVFIDLIGFGMVVPLISLYSRHYGASGLVIGVIGASFSAMQFVFSPIWGRLSDRYGRKPILLISTAGAALSYVLFALASGIENHHLALWGILISRSFAGICGGNITVAQAYIADITPPQDRSRKMGLIGMAFGLGFIFGPIISGIGLKFLGATGPGWLAAGLCAANFFLALTVLAESRQPGSEHVPSRPHLTQWIHTLSQPKVGLLIGVFFLATFCFSCFELTLPFLINDNFHLGLTAEETKAATTVIWLFVFCGLIGALIQGGAIGRLVKMMGEPKLIALSLFITGVSFVFLPFIKGNGQLLWGRLVHPDGVSWLKMLSALALLAIGSSLTRAPVFGLLSNLTPANEQGATIGVAQSAGSLARILGPLFAGPVYFHSPALPFLICAGIAVLAGVIAAQRLRGAHGNLGTTTPAL